MIWTGSVLVYFFAVIAYSLLSSIAPWFYGVGAASYSLSTFWLKLLLVPVLAMSVDVLFQYLQEEFFPTPVTLGVERNR